MVNSFEEAPAPAAAAVATSDFQLLNRTTEALNGRSAMVSANPWRSPCVCKPPRSTAATFPVAPSVWSGKCAEGQQAPRQCVVCAAWSVHASGFCCCYPECKVSLICLPGVVTDFWLLTLPLCFPHVQLGFVAAVVAESATHQTVFSQVAGKYVDMELVEAPLGAASLGFGAVVALVTMATLMPKLIDGMEVDSKSFGPFTPALESKVGRVAMMGFAGLLAVELVKGSALL